MCVCVCVCACVRARAIVCVFVFVCVCVCLCVCKELAWVAEERARVLYVEAHPAGRGGGEEGRLAREGSEEGARGEVAALGQLALPGEWAEAAGVHSPEVVAGSDEVVPLAVRLGQDGEVDSLHQIEDVHAEEAAVKPAEGRGYCVGFGCQSVV